MSEPRRQTRSAGAWRCDQQSDAQFWSNQLDPALIKRGQTKAIQLVRNTVNPTTTLTTSAAAAASSSITQTSVPTETNMTNTSRVPCMVFVDDEGLEEQFLTGDEASQEVIMRSFLMCVASRKMIKVVIYWVTLHAQG